MPSIASRTVPVQSAIDTQHAPATPPASSPPGVPPVTTAMAPSRGIPPIEYSYQASLAQVQPDTPYFQRSNIDVTTAVRNTALLALTKQKFTKSKVGAPS